MAAVAQSVRVAWAGIHAAVMALGSDLHEPRSAAIYLLVTGVGVPGAEAGRLLGCSKQNVSKILRRVEDRRDCPKFDARLEALEQTLFEGV